MSEKIKHALKDDRPCLFYGRDQTFVCASCKERCCYCFGAAGSDATDSEVCDDCWYAAHIAGKEVLK